MNHVCETPKASPALRPTQGKTGCQGVGEAFQEEDTAQSKTWELGRGEAGIKRPSAV